MRTSISVIFFLLLGIFANTSIAQTYAVDSLNILLKEHKQNDSSKVNLLNEIAYELKNVDPDATLKYANEALRLSDSLDFKTGKAGAYLQLAYYYSLSSDFTLVLKYAQQSMDIFECQNNIWGKAHSMHVLGRTYYFKGNIDKAMSYLNSALTLSIEIKDSLETCYIYATLGTNYSDIGDYTKALAFTKKSLEIANKIKNEEAASFALNNLGVVYEIKGDFPKALECYQKSFSFDENHKNYKDAAVSASNVAGILKFQGNYNSAIKFCLKGIEYAEMVGYKTGLTYNYEYLGQIYKEQGDFDKARQAYQINMKIQEEIGNMKAVAMAYRDMADLYLLQNKLDSALSFYNNSIKLSKAIVYKQMEADGYVGIAQVNYNKKRYNEAYNFSKKAYEIATDIGNNNTIKNSTKVLALSCEALGYYKEAYQAQVTYKLMSDSLFNDLNIKNIANLEYQYKYEKEKEILEVEQERKDKLAAFEIRKQKAIRNILMVGIAIMLSLMFIILRVLIQKRSANKLLKIKNDEIENQAEELKVSNESLVQLSHFKEDMTNMIVHDLKNPLSAIINVSVIEDEERRMALVKHSGFQMLNLVENILEVYKYESAEIELSKENVQLRDLIENSIEEVEFLADKKDLEFKVDIDAEMFVNADSRLLRRTVVNILSNAVKFALGNSIVSIRGFLFDKNKLKVEIHNIGSYIPPEKQDLIFDKFGQAGERIDGKLSSTGLGLTYCKLVVNAHEGSLGVFSDQNDGTTFWFVIPMLNNYQIDL